MRNLRGDKRGHIRFFYMKEPEFDHLGDSGRLGKLLLLSIFEALTPALREELNVLLIVRPRFKKLYEQLSDIHMRKVLIQGYIAATQMGYGPTA